MVFKIISVGSIPAFFVFLKCFILMKGTIVDLSNNLKYFKSFLRLFFIPFFYVIYTFNFLLSSNLNTDVNLTSSYYFQKKKWNFIKLNKFYFLLDLIYFYFIGTIFKNSKYNNFNLRMKTRLKQVN